MRDKLYISFYCAWCIVLCALLLACAGNDGKFHIEGNMKNMNQARFLVYSDEGDVLGIDTIVVAAGRFEHSFNCPRPTTLIIVFPNLTEHPVFAEPGKKVKIEGDASHLKQLTVKGNTDNELMNELYPKLADASQSEKMKITEQVVTEHPDSRVAVYLVRRYLVLTNTPDYDKACALVDTMLVHQPSNGVLLRMQQDLEGRGVVKKGEPIASFRAIDVKGNEVTDSLVAAAEYGVVLTWASWMYDTTNSLRQLGRLQKDVAKGRLVVIGISMDLSERNAVESMQRDSLPVTIICDEKGIESPLLCTIGLYGLPDNVLIHNGKVEGRGIPPYDMANKMRDTFKSKE